MQEIRQNTEIKIRIGSAVDFSDGISPETSLTLGAADQSEILKHNGAATVDISSNTFTAITGVDGWYDLTLTPTDTNTLGLLTVVIQDSSLMVPIFKDFMVVTTNYWDTKYATDAFDVNIISQANIDFGVLQKASINTECDTALTDYDAATTTNLATVDGNVDAILMDTGTTIPNQITALNDLSAAEVNVEVSDVFKVDTIVEMAQGALPASPTMEQILNYLYRALRNRSETTTSETAIYNDAGTDKIFKASISYNEPTTTFTKDEYGTGA